MVKKRPYVWFFLRANHMLEHKATITRAFILFILLSGNHFVVAQEASIKFEHLVIEEGLSHNWTKCIKKDSKGFLWVGTMNGLNRYDGKTFKIFKSDESVAESISDNFIQAIEEDKNGDLWVGTYSGGINRYNKFSEKFLSFEYIPNDSFSISANRIYSVLNDSKGRLWIGTEKGLDQFDFEKEYFIHITNFSPPQELIKGVIYDICESDNGAIWIASSTGLYQLNLENNDLEKFTNEPDNQYSISSNHVTQVYEDAYGNIWVGTLGGGLNLYNKSNNKFTRFNTDEEVNRLNHNSVLALSGDKKRRLYIGTEGGGLSIMDIPTKSIKTYLPDPNYDKSINSNSVHSIYYDEVSRVTWVGTYHGGLNYFSSWDKPFIHYKSQTGQLNNNNILSFTEDKDGNIYVGTDGGGVNIIHEKSGKSRFLVHEESNPNSILSDAVLAVHVDRAQNLWVGSFNGGLDCIQKNGKMKHLQNDPSNENSISNNDVSAIFEDSRGNIWIGTMKGGINLLDPNSGKILRFQKESNSQSSVADNFISKVFESRDGMIMIQTGKSMDVYNYENNSFHRFGDDFDLELGMPIASLEDSKGNFWISGREQLFYLNSTDKTHQSFTAANGLPSNSIVGILEDAYGNLWLSTMKGLVKANGAVNNQENISFQVFTPAEGLQGLNFTEQACFKSKSGFLYFGGQNGFNAFRSKDILVNPVAPEIVFTSFKLFNEDVKIGMDETLPKPINELKEINLPYESNVITLGFSALNFIQPEKNQYAYRMENFEERWNAVGNNSSATYTNLDPGDYVFHVKASNNDGIWNDVGSSISIKISPPWWNTIWFKIIMGLMAIAIIVTYFRVRLYVFRARQKILKKQVKEATIQIQHVNELLADRNIRIEKQNAILLDKNDQLTIQNHELENQSNEIKRLLNEIQELTEMKLRFFTNISHELRTPLTLILGPLENLLNKDSEKAPFNKELNVMYRNASKLKHLINQLLDFRKIETGNLELNATQIDIVGFTKEIFDSFSLLADRKEINYQFWSEKNEIQTWFDPEKMEKIITNLLSNAFKFTRHSISVHIIRTLEFVQMEFSDTGNGIPVDQKEHIFDLYYQAKNSQNLRQAGTGIGLALIKQYVELHRGKIEVQSKPGEGATFKLYFRLGKNHFSSNEIKKSSIDYKSECPILEFQDTAPIYSSAQELSIKDDGESLLSFKPVLLIVEDNDDIRRYIKNVFHHQFQIYEAQNGEEGLQIAQDVIPDIIISDVKMPKVNGFELCHQIKNDERTSHISIILLTAFSEEKKQIDGLASGADDYLTKPFNAQVLQRKILNVMQTRRNLMENFKNQSTLELDSLATKTEDRKFIRKAIGLIDQNLTSVDFGVEEFSQEFHMSRRTLLRKIKGITGLSVNEFIKNIKLKKSVQLLQLQSMNVSEVAYAVGFNDPKYFSRCFKEQFGKSPKDYLVYLRETVNN